VREEDAAGRRAGGPGRSGNRSARPNGTRTGEPAFRWSRRDEQRREDGQPLEGPPPTLASAFRRPPRRDDEREPDEGEERGEAQQAGVGEKVDLEIAGPGHLAILHARPPLHRAVAFLIAGASRRSRAWR
jgi:hypothetical protein